VVLNNPSCAFRSGERAAETLWSRSPRHLGGVVIVAIRDVGRTYTPRLRSQESPLLPLRKGIVVPHGLRVALSLGTDRPDRLSPQGFAGRHRRLHSDQARTVGLHNYCQLRWHLTRRHCPPDPAVTVSAHGLSRAAGDFPIWLRNSGEMRCIQFSLEEVRAHRIARALAMTCSASSAPVVPRRARRRAWRPHCSPGFSVELQIGLSRNDCLVPESELPTAGPGQGCGSSVSRLGRRLWYNTSTRSVRPQAFPTVREVRY